MLVYQRVPYSQTKPPEFQQPMQEPFQFQVSLLRIVDDVGELDDLHIITVDLEDVRKNLSRNGYHREQYSYIHM